MDDDIYYTPLCPDRSAKDTILLDSVEWIPATLCPYMSPKDVLAFSSTSKSTQWARLVRFHNWESSKTWANPPSCFHAMHWQTLPIREMSLHTVFVTMKWKDQGWGNRKGMVSIVDENQHALNNREPAAPDDFGKWPSCIIAGREPAPHTPESLQFVFTPESPETSYSLWVRVGGGGGHELHVEDCTLRAIQLTKF